MGIIKAAKLAFDYLRYGEEGEEPEVNRAIDHVDLDIEEGQFIAILGHNGSGKSTLAKHINGLLVPTEGTLWVDHMDTASDADIWNIRQKAGMVFQNPDNQIIGTVVEEDVGFGPENLGVPTEDIWKRVDESLQAVGMTAYRHHSPNKLSGGQKQRVAIAGVMAMHPKCIVLDEPTSFLDVRYKLELLSILRNMAKKKGITVIMSLHEIDLAEKVADKIICVKGDRIAHYGKPETIFKEEAIRDLYGIDNGYFDPVFGSLELPRPEGEPKTLVISSGGTGIPIYRELQRKNIPFAAGILYTNDIDYQLARLLAVRTVTEKPFEEISDETFARAVEVMKKCKRVIVTDVPVGECNKRIEELIKLVK